MIPEDDGWHDRINRQEDNLKRYYFAKSDADAVVARLKSEGKKAHVCPECLHVLECDS